MKIQTNEQAEKELVACLQKVTTEEGQLYAQKDDARKTTTGVACKCCSIDR